MANQKPLIVVNGTNQQLPNGDTLVVGTGIDASVAGTLTVGGTTATSIVLGSATIPVSIPGDVTTVGGTTFTTDATFEGDVTFGNAATDTVTFTAEVDSAIAFKAPGYKITNLANGTNPGDAVNFSQLSAIVSGVSAVTASAPLASSGGATPDISLTGIVPVANGGTGTSTAFTPGSVVFAGASGVYSQDNANLFWDDTNNRFGIGTSTPSSTFSVGASSEFQVNSTGNLVKVNNVTTSFPASQGGAGTVLTNDGSGNLSWSAAAAGTITGSGTATQIAFFTGASAIGSETAVGSDSFTWNSTDELLGVRTSSPSNVVDVQAGALNSGQSALSVTGTLSSTVATQRGVTMFITGAGSSTQQIEGVIAGISGGGYTGSGASIGANIYNESVGTGNQPFAQQWGNFAVRGQAYGASATGHNVGFYATAQNALRNFGFVSAQTTSSQANGYNVGIATVAHNAAASGVRVGGYFSVDTTFLPAEPTLISAALIADNTSTTDPIFLARDSGTTTFSIGNNGVVLAKNTADSTTAFSVQDSSGNTLLGIDTVNDRVGVGGVAGASLTHTFNVGAAAANFCVGSGGRIHTYAGTAPTNGQVLIGDTLNGHFDKAALTAGAGISITNGAGSITIAATSGVQAITTIGVTTTLDGTNYTVLCSATLTVNLPAAASNTGRVYNIKNIGAAATITIDGNAAETIDGAATYTLTTQYQSVTIQSDGSNWFIL